MTWLPKEAEISSLLSADGRRRYEYFIHRVCDTRQIWSLFENGWAALGDPDGQKLFPLWPHEKYAAAFKTGEWDGYIPKLIELEPFIEEWLPGMKESGVAPAVFPLPNGSSVVVPCEELQADLRHELSKY